jgi:hypothetical protein
VKTAHRNLVEAGPDEHSAFSGGLNEHLALTVQGSQEISTIEWNEKFGDVRKSAQPIGQSAQHVCHALTGSRRKRNASGMVFKDFFGSIWVDIDLVHHKHLRNVSSANLVQYSVDSFDVGFRVGSRAIDNMNQKVCVDNNFERGLKRFNELRRKLGDESDGVSE